VGGVSFKKKKKKEMKRFVNIEESECGEETLLFGYSLS
jgi:hypothetical protein